MAHAAVLVVDVPRAWARSGRATSEARLRYSPTDCFQNFPFPDDVSVLSEVGDRYLDYRKETLLARTRA